MEYRILTLLTIFLIISSTLSVVSADITGENSTDILNTQTISIKESETEESEAKNETKRIGERVSATSDGYQNITFDDGYNGYCANKYLKDADAGDTFIVQDTSKLVNPNYNESVGNYLKILFVDHYDYVMANPLMVTLAVWEFTDNPYTTDSYLEIIPEILKEAQDGRIIPDHGEIKKINNTTEAIFDFECLQSTDDKIQNFFGYKITYREILTGIMGNVTLENSTQTESGNNETQENSNDTAENNETTKTENNIISSNKSNNSSNVMGEAVDNESLENENDSINLIKYPTGNNTTIGLALLLLSAIFLIIKLRD